MKRNAHEHDDNDTCNDEQVAKTETSYNLYDTIPDDYFGYHELSEVPNISTYGVLHQNLNTSKTSLYL